MKKMKQKHKFLLTTIIALLISSIIIILNANTYTIKNEYIKDYQNTNITVEDENIIEIIDKKIKNDKLEIKIKSKSEGKTYITIETEDEYYYYALYVHSFGIITFNQYLGDFTGSFIIPVLSIFLLSYILFIAIEKYIKNTKENMYQYKNIITLGIIVFIIFSIISQLIATSNSMGLKDLIDSLLNMYSISILILPVLIIVSILVIISNILLIKKEGFNTRNILGTVLSIVLCLLTLLPGILYDQLNTASWINIHNEQAIDLYIYNFIESTIMIITTYIECLLIGTAIVALKAAKNVPSFDKDAIIILGCKINNDGTLTNLLKARVDRAIEFSKMQKNKKIYFVPSGGKGDDEIISEAQAMKNYLVEQGIDEKRILIEDKSTSTYENIKFSNEIINKKIKKAKIAFSTTNYHVFRAGNIAYQQSLNYEGIGAKTKSYFWINAFIREFIATLYMGRKKHIEIIVCIIVSAALMIFATYLNGNM